MARANETLTDENRAMQKAKVEVAKLKEENKALSELSSKQGEQLKESTREYFTESMAKKDAMLDAYRIGEERAVARLKQLTESSSAATRKAEESDAVITDLRAKVELSLIHI